MEKNKTAVDWLFEQFESGDMWNMEDAQRIKHQAKKMEKEQMHKTWEDGFSFQSPYKNFEEYYNETYGK